MQMHGKKGNYILLIIRKQGHRMYKCTEHCTYWK